MAVIDRIPLQRSVAVVRDDSISIRPGRAQLLGTAIQGAIAAGAVGLIVAFLDRLPLWLLMALLLVALLFGPVAVLGLVHNVYGSSFLIERRKQSARWQQGFLGLGIGTAELVPFDRIAHIEVLGDFEDELSSGQQQDFVQFDVSIVKDNERVLDVASVASPRSLVAGGRERANRLASHIGAMTGAEVRLAAVAVAEEAAAAPARPRRRRRRISRSRGAQP
jgi:hypothetical protein